MSETSAANQMSALGQASAAPATLEAWPEAPALGEGSAGGGPASGKRHRRHSGHTITNTSSNAVGFREYFKYKELFINLTLRETRSKYKRSVIGWGWSMINPLANMAVYTIVFSLLFGISAPEGLPSHLNSYALMYLSAMLPFVMWQGSIMESMSAILGNQNLIQKTWFPRELIPAATVAAKLVSHVIEMALVLTVIVAVGNWRALEFLPGIILTMAFITVFALGMSLLFSISNAFWRDIQHFSNILFFIWMFLTPVAYPYYILGGGLDGSPSKGVGVLIAAKHHLFGHNLGTIFKLNPMTDAVLTMQSFIYDGSFPGTVHKVLFPLLGPTGVPLAPSAAQFAATAQATVKAEAAAGFSCSVASKGVTCLVPSNVSWFDVVYFVAWALAIFVIGLWVFRRYEARLPEEL